ncbi:HD family phosphohydrolase [Thalassobacillus hwangdonensis]|uniref:HD family phosphohydrolase n=1 Tax=Thalassobacillus hwangdonensis TaxID=546108 RepID=A0ABW3KY32_9BACI
MKNSNKKRIKSYFSRYQSMVRLLIPSLIAGVFFFLFTLSNVFTQTYDLELFSTAQETIRSPITIEDKESTEREIREASQSVQDRFSTSVAVTQERIAYIDEIFDALKNIESNEQAEDADEPKNLSTLDKTQRLQQLLSKEITVEVDRAVLESIVAAPANDRDVAYQLLKTSLYDQFNDGIKAEDEIEAEQQVKLSLQYSTLHNELKESIIRLSQFAIVPNSFFDEEKTASARKQAAESVEPVTIRAGEVIVNEGATINKAAFEKLKLVGLLNNERNLFPVFGLGLLALLLGAVLFYELYRLDRKGKMSIQKVTAVLLISLGMLAFLKMASFFVSDGMPLYYLVPVAAAAILIKVLVDERLAIVLAGVMAVLGSFLFNGQIAGSLNAEAGIYIGLSQLAGVAFLYNLKDRLAILKACAGVAAINVLTVLLFLFISFEKYTIGDIFLQSGYGIASAFLSSVLALGLLPFFETGFGILSDSKLLTLSNPNHPLLRKLLTQSPGTYHHSVMVANLSEAACEAIGANGLLARVAAYYHDLGKTVRPHFFIENQMGMKNPHDFIDPEQSAEIIIRHPYDGAAMLREEKLPKEIVDIAEQHHGTTLLKFFYYKAKEKHKEVNAEEFRYPGPKPQTKEAAIICICDSVEAAVRSMDEPTTEKIREIVSNITHDRLMDGQLDECTLTFRELTSVQNAICETLQGFFHSRIQYPETGKNLIKEAK